MKLQIAVIQYLTYRKSLGEQFLTNDYYLRTFVRAIGQKKNLSDVQAKQVSTFLAGKGPITSSWHAKYQALYGFYRYVVSRRYIKTSPLPTTIPKRPQSLVPYIYDVKELRALLDGSLTYQKNRGRLEPYMVRMFLLLLFSAGLRFREAINLTMADVNLSQAVLTIRETKFRKTRLVPLGAQLTQSLSQYALRRQQEGYSQNHDAPFFIGRNGESIKKTTFQAAFRAICKKAGIKRTDNTRYQPRIHDLRHSFAVHRLTEWYKEGSDVQELLPVLSVFMGHAKLAGTSVYLTMTPTLLEEAGHRFQNYAFKETLHD